MSYFSGQHMLRIFANVAFLLFFLPSLAGRGKAEQGSKSPSLVLTLHGKTSGADQMYSRNAVCYLLILELFFFIL